jgi:release factor glutamine methyltransferase
MKTVLEILNRATEYLQQKNIPHPRREAEDLIGDALNLTRIQLYLDHERPLQEAELEMLRQRLRRRGNREPGAYIHGETEFYGCSLAVNPHVLIPRQETEILTDKIVRRLQQEELAGKQFWDVCTGSGCLAIAIKKRFPALEVKAADLCAKALETAASNAAKNDVEITFLQGDLLHPFEAQKAHFIVCNPPYIAEQDYMQLEPEVRDFEPRLALVGGATGLEYYQRLAQALPSFMAPQGLAWFEIGAGQGLAIQTLFSGQLWKKSVWEGDWSGQDRFFFLEIE